MIEILTDADAFAARAQALLSSTVRNTVPATVLDSIRTGRYPNTDWRFALVSDGAGVVTAAALRTPPRAMLCTAIGDGDADRLMGAWLEHDPELPAVNAMADTARTLAAAFRARAGGRSELTMEMALHALEPAELVDPPRPAAGTLRAPRPPEYALIGEWCVAFAEESDVAESPAEARRAARSRLERDLVFVWDDGGEPVSLVGRTVAVAGVPRIGPVYTPPERRSRGYASTAVAELGRPAFCGWVGFTLGGSVGGVGVLGLLLVFGSFVFSLPPRRGSCSSPTSPIRRRTGSTGTSASGGWPTTSSTRSAADRPGLKAVAPPADAANVSDRDLISGPAAPARSLADIHALTPVGWWDWDLTQERPWWSDQMCRIYGVPEGTGLTMDEFRALIHPDDLQDVSDRLARREVSESTYRIIRPDGQVRLVLGRRSGRFDADGRLTHVYGIVQDLTAQHAAERERDAARDLFESAFSHAAIGMALVGLDGRWLKVNRALCRMTGWAPQELLERTFQDITHPDDLSADLALVRRLVAGEIDDYQMEKRYLTRGGQHIWALLSVSLVRDERGAPEHLIAQIQDIDDRRRTERLLRETEADVRQERDHARTILAAMHEGYVLTINGEIVDVNDALCELTGMSRQRLVGSRPPYPFWPPELALALTGERERHFQAGVGGTFEATFQRGDGTRFEAEVTAKPAFKVDGTLLGFVNTIRDVSLRNRQRRELERRARTDGLTGVANRYVLDEELEQATLARPDERVALVLFDIDRFKQINDEHGHPVGDAVLAEVAARLSEIVREGEVLARVGGEEFAWLLSGCDEAGARAAADRARAEIAATPFADAGVLTLSAGIGVTRTPCNPARLYALADRALYEAKRSGRNRTRCCQDPARTADPAQPRSFVAAAPDAIRIAADGESLTPTQP